MPSICTSTSETKKIPSRTKRFSCPDCGVLFLKPAHVRRHQLTHRDIRKFQCLEKGCGKWFSRQEHLLRHKQSHMNTKGAFTCPIEGCEKTFKFKYGMKRHLQTHSKQRDTFECTQCDDSAEDMFDSMLYNHCAFHPSNQCSYF